MGLGKYEMRDVYYKKLSSAIVKTGKPQDLKGESPCWRPRRGDSVVLVQKPAGFKFRKSQYCSLSLKAGKILSYPWEGPVFCSFHAFNYSCLIPCGGLRPTTPRMAICFPQSNDSTINLIKKHAEKCLTKELGNP